MPCFGCLHPGMVQWMIGLMPLPKTGATHYHTKTKVGLQSKGWLLAIVGI